jgi:hypothetical protein
MPVDILTVRVLNAKRALFGIKAEWNCSNEMKTLPEDNTRGKEEASESFKLCVQRPEDQLRF